MSKGGMEETPFEAIRKGLVSSVNRESCTAKVYFPDLDEKVSFDLPVMQKNTLNTKYYWLPQPNEQVICAFFANGSSEGIVLGAIYSEADTVPQELSEDGCEGVIFSDGTTIKYDVKSHILTIDVKGSVQIKTEKDFVVNGKVIE